MGDEFECPMQAVMGRTESVDDAVSGGAFAIVIDARGYADLVFPPHNNNDPMPDHGWAATVLACLLGEEFTDLYQQASDRCLARMGLMRRAGKDVH